jgi:hypothetical protein
MAGKGLPSKGGKQFVAVSETAGKTRGQKNGETTHETILKRKEKGEKRKVKINSKRTCLPFLIPHF